MKVRTRMAPSPTGEIHVGSMATLLKNYAFAKKNGGQFILRIEDTDQTREVPGAVERILKTVSAYGLQWDEGPDIGGPFAPYTQSQRLPRYSAAAEQLVTQGQAYRCFCTKERLETVHADQVANKQQPKYDGHCRNLSADEVARRLAQNESSVIRLKVPKEESISFTDLIRGPITVSGNDVDDQVLLKSDGFPTYHLAVVVDDNDMEVTHILRGEEWISSTPKHILLYRAFGWTPPIFAHIPIFLNPDGKGKMSKRKGDVSAQSFLNQGFLPEAMLNFFMILGWAPSDQREILTLDEYVREFDPSAISAKSVVFDLKKLAWMNGVYIRALSPDDLARRLEPFIPVGRDPSMMKQIIPLVAERLVTLADIGPLTAYFFENIEPNPAELLRRAESKEVVIGQLEQTINVLNQLESWTVEALEKTLRQMQLDHDWQPKQYFMLLRVALTAQTATPPLFDTMFVLGKSLVAQRLTDSQALLRQTNV